MSQDVIGDLERALDALAAADPHVLADSDSVLRLTKELSRAEAVVTRVTGAWDTSRVWEVDGARTAGAWLTHKARLPKPAIWRRLRLAKALRGLPAAEAAWLAGEIDGAHVSALSSACCTSALSDAMRRDEPMLVRHAKAMTYAHFGKALAYWQMHADPNEGEDRYAKLHDERRADRATTWRGHLHLNAWLDPIAGTVVDTVLRGIEDDLFEQDWAEAKARLGREPSISELARTAAQRRADALLEMALRAATAPADGRRPEPCFTVMIGLPGLEKLCELADGTVIPHGALLPWLGVSWIERVVFGAPSRVLDVGVRQRLFTGAIRRAIQVRDRECFHGLCDEPGHNCQVDHIDPYTNGGDTTQDNGQLACDFHNRKKSNNPPNGP